DRLVSGRDPIDFVGLRIGRARGRNAQDPAGEQNHQATRSWSGACSFRYPDADPEHWLSHPLIWRGSSPRPQGPRTQRSPSGLGSPAQTVRIEILFRLSARTRQAQPPSRALTRSGTDASAASRAAGLLPPACAKSGLPPPRPPSVTAMAPASSPALMRAV